MFDEYNQHGPLYVFHDKKANKKYQFHFNSNQFMNEHDYPVNTLELDKNHTILQKHFGKKNIA